MKKLLVLGGSEFQIHLLKTAKEMGLYVCVVDINEDAPALKSGCYDEFYKCSLKDREGVLRIAKEFKPDGITVGMVDIAVPACAYVAEQLGLPGMSMSSAVKSTDKYEMIKAFEQNNVPHPWYRYIRKEEIASTDTDIDYPVIVKPVDMAGSRGIYLVNTAQELINSIKCSSELSDRGDVIVEEYLDGPEVSVEIVVKNGVPYVMQVTDKTTSGAPHFAETGHLQPSQLPFKVIEDIKHVACEAAKALELKNSLGHAEIKATSNGAKMIEMGARAGGDGIAEQLIELSAGVSFSEYAIKIALGMDFDVPDQVNNNASCIRFIISEDGTLEEISGVEEAINIEGVEEVGITGVVGKAYSAMVDNSGRLGHVICSAKTADSVQKICDEAIDTIKVKYKR